MKRKTTRRAGRKRRRSRAVTPARHPRRRENHSGLFLFLWEVAEQLLISETAVRRLISTGDLRGTRIGKGRVNVLRADFDAYVAALKEESHVAAGT